jgi:hypothetical protein
VAADGLGYVVRSQRNFLDRIETKTEASLQDPVRVNISAKLAQEGRRDQSYVITKPGALLQAVGDRNLGLIGTDTDALAAVNTPLLEDVGPSLPHPDGLRRAALDAVGASLTLLAVEGD